MDDAEVLHQRYRTRRIREVTSQFDIQVSKLIDRPVVSRACYVYITEPSGRAEGVLA